ncbi:MAG: M23 family metallopeptidase [Bacteroidota bacterium]
MRKYWFLLILIFVWINSCQKQIPVGLSSFTAYEDYHSSQDSVWLKIRKEIPGPIHFYLSSKNQYVDEQLKAIAPIILTDDRDRRSIELAHQETDSLALRKSFSGNSYFGNPMSLDTQLTLAWPFPKGKKYKITQAYNGSFSHQSEDSRYAIDFNLAVGDTICAAQDGLVVNVLQENTKGGNNRKYEDFANYITIYHPDGYLTQYVHLKPNSAFVKAGEQVKKGQPIALSGLTGFTSGSHLHFNVRKPMIKKVPSTPAVFEQMAGKDLKKGMWVEH